jgi:large subunit ribosomal protein L4
MTVEVYTAAGNKSTTTVKLDKSVFGVIPENHETLKMAYLAYLDNGRKNLAVTKTRGQVRGGGIKPWRQKGTGRARFGSIRVPIWRGGGITFGPTGKENYTIKLSLNTKRLATRQALSMATKENRLIVIEELKIKTQKTAEAAKLLHKLGAEGNTLIVVEQKTPEFLRAFNNLANVNIVQSKYLNSYSIVNADKIIISSASIKEIQVWLGEER